MLSYRPLEVPSTIKGVCDTLSIDGCVNTNLNTLTVSLTLTARNRNMSANMGKCDYFMVQISYKYMRSISILCPCY